MITFDLNSMRSVSQSLQGANNALFDLTRAARKVGVFTSAPAMASAFTQHKSFFSGQIGSAENAIVTLQSDIQWLQQMFSSHVQAFDLQDKLSAGSFSQMNSMIEVPMTHVSVPMPPRVFKPISNLLYTTPVAAAEATTPLEALISMFEGNDGAPMQMAMEWSMAAEDLLIAMESLTTAAATIDIAAHGFSFDVARDAIGDVITLGRTVGTNAMLMADSIAKFPAVRIANLSALRTIQANTATIQDPIEKQVAQQAAVANFVSSQLQPSLETLRPPVSNFGVPVVGHTGSGLLNTSTTSTGSQHTIFHTPQGGPLNVTNAVINNLESGASNAVADVPNPSGTVAPASAASTQVSNATQAANQVTGGNLASTPQSTAPNSLPAGNNTFTNPGALGSPNAATTQPAGLGNAAAPSPVQGGVGPTSTGQPAGAGRAGSGPVVPRLPGMAQGTNAGTRTGLGASNGAQSITGGRLGGAGQGSGRLNAGLNGSFNGSPHSGSGRAGMGNAGRFGSATPHMQGVGAPGGTGSGSQYGTKGGPGALKGAPTPGSHLGAGSGNNAPGASRGDGMMAAGPGGTAGGRGGQGMAGTGARSAGHGNARNAKTRAGIFGKGQWAPGVSEYFKRQFLGSKKRTVREVIR